MEFFVQNSTKYQKDATTECFCKPQWTIYRDKYSYSAKPCSFLQILTGFQSAKKWGERLKEKIGF